MTSDLAFNNNNIFKFQDSVNALWETQSVAIHHGSDIMYYGVCCPVRSITYIPGYPEVKDVYFSAKMCVKYVHVFPRSELFWRTEKYALQNILCCHLGS